MRTPEYAIHNEDCIPGMAERLADESVDLVVSSIPFGSLFMYSGKIDDIGNNRDGVHMLEEQFALHMQFCVSQLYRVMKPGRKCCIHIQQLISYKNQHGDSGMRDFRGAVIRLFENHGFVAHGEVAIPKNPQAVARRLQLRSLQFKTARTNSRLLVPAMNDYMLFFWKRERSEPEPGDAVAGMRDPEKNPDGWFTSEEWVKWACGVWGDILEIDTLDGWRSARGSDEEKHVCPLQLEPIRRCVKMFTGPGELVLDPFMGIGSTAAVAIHEGRDAVGFELKESYHAQAVRNCDKAVREWERARHGGGLFAAIVARDDAS
jgi:DNA modification methylase